MKTICPLFAFLFISALFLSSCGGNEEPKNTVNNDSVANDSGHVKSINQDSFTQAVLKNLPPEYKLIFGYRFVITGDFNGDGKQETLTEHYVSAIDNKETCKFYDSTLNEDQFIALIYQKQPKTFLSCSDKKIDTLQIEQGEQVLGIAFLRNEGDLDGDGGDEISFVRDWADWSNMNSLSVYTCKGGVWKEYISFEIHEANLPQLPEYNPKYKNAPGNMLLKYYDADTTFARLEKELKNFMGFVHPLGKGKIKIEVYDGANGNYVEKEVDLSKLER